MDEIFDDFLRDVVDVTDDMVEFLDKVEHLELVDFCVEYFDNVDLPEQEDCIDCLLDFCSHTAGNFCSHTVCEIGK